MMNLSIDGITHSRSFFDFFGLDSFGAELEEEAAWRCKAASNSS